MSTSSTASFLPLAANASRDRLRLLAFRNHGRDVAEDVRDAKSRHVLRQIAPVRSDVAERRRRAALVGLETPRVVRVLEQPVLQVVADQKMRRADVAARDHVPRLLHERVAAVVERHRVDHAGLRRLIEQLLRFLGGHRERLVGDDVLPLGDRGRVDGVVKVVRRRVVDDLHVRVVEQRLVAAVRLGDSERLRFRGGRVLVTGRQGDDVHEPQPPHGVHMMRSDKPCADDPHPDPFHVQPPETFVLLPSPSDLEKRGGHHNKFPA